MNENLNLVEILKENPIGVKVGKLTIIREVERAKHPNGRTSRRFECVCDCGKICKVKLHALRRGRVCSCGCLKTETTIKKFTKHGLSKRHPLYGIWKGMKERCVNPNHFAYKDYGGRGIVVCDQWSHDFSIFYEWCISNGWRKGLSIDRVDNNKGYSPENCRFVDIFTQARNKRNNRQITYKGNTWHSVAQFCSDMNIKYRRFYQRIKRGMSVEKAVELK